MVKKLVKVNKNLVIDENGHYPALLVTENGENRKLFVCTGFEASDFYRSINLKVLEYHWTTTGSWAYVKPTVFNRNIMSVNNNTWVDIYGMPTTPTLDSEGEPITTGLVGELDFYHASPVGQGIMLMIQDALDRRVVE